jgi:chemotaxis protein methyltransferase CheR
MVPERLSEQEFKAFQAFIHGAAGIYLTPAKNALLVGRLGRHLRELGLSSFGEYLERAKRVPEERVRLIDSVCTNETRFFREPGQFQFLEEQLLPSWRARAAAGQRPRRIRVWSAACSTGEEPFSLAMLLLDACPQAEGWQIEVLASDLSTRVLARAKEAVWPIARAADIPDRYLRRFMLRGVGDQAGQMKARPELRQAIRFAALNLNADRYPVAGAFDLIFCRNVLIYFDAESKAAVIERLRERLEPEGHLFLGHAEGLGRATVGVKAVAPNVYARGLAA